MIRMRRALVTGALLGMAAAGASAQVPWETPQLLAPHAPRGLGLVLVSWAAAPGDGLGAVLTLRPAAAPTGLGFRLAAGAGRAGERALGGGIELSGWIARASATFPLDVIWTTGVGAAHGQSTQVAVPLGAAAGRSFDGSVWVNPYAAARVILEGRTGDNAPGDALDVQLATELGANLSFDRNRRFILRLAGSFGDRAALAVGAHVGGGPRDPPAHAVR